MSNKLILTNVLPAGGVTILNWSEHYLAGVIVNICVSLWCGRFWQLVITLLCVFILPESTRLGYTMAYNKTNTQQYSVKKNKKKQNRH